jgi:hypothetical protein
MWPPKKKRHRQRLGAAASDWLRVKMAMMSVTGTRCMSSQWLIYSLRAKTVADRRSMDPGFACGVCVEWRVSWAGTCRLGTAADNDRDRCLGNYSRSAQAVLKTVTHCRHTKILWLRKSWENAVNWLLLHTKIKATKVWKTAYSAYNIPGQGKSEVIDEKILSKWLGNNLLSCLFRIFWTTKFSMASEFHWVGIL